MSTRAGFVGFVMTLACGRSTSTVADSPTPRAEASAAVIAPTETLDALRESARMTLVASCAECHTTGLATALPGALRVFDLTESEFSRRMSAAQLREASRRLGEPFAPTRGEGDVRPIDVSPEDRARFARFVDAEIARRARPGP